MDHSRERMSRLFAPQTIAVVGGVEAERVVLQCRKMQFAGTIWAVNPKRQQQNQTLADLPCYAAVGDLPSAPDAAFIAAPADASIDIVRQLNAIGAGGAVCYASGFEELGETGAARCDKLREAARDMPVLGPNCYGYINALCGAALWPDQHGLARCEKGAALIVSSGNIGLNLTLQQRGLAIAHIISVGNQTVLGVESCMQVALNNPDVTAIGVLLEGLADLPQFVRAMQLAREKKIPVVALKSGQSAAGARIAMSHTAALAGEDALNDALFERLGVARVHDLETFLESLKLLSTGALNGNRISSLSCSGGEAALMADLAADTSLVFPPMSDAHKKTVRATLNEYVSVDNPLDYHTFIWGDRARQQKTFAAMMRGGYDLNLLVLDFPFVNDCDMQDWVAAMRAFCDAAEETQSRAAVVVSLSENLPPSARDALCECGVTPLFGMRQALAAIEAAAFIGRCWREEFVAPSFNARAGDAGETYLDEFDAKTLLQRAGVPAPKFLRANNADEAVAHARQLGFPVAVKALARGLTHKTEKGAVAINLQDADAVAQAASRMLQFADAVLVEQMVGDGAVELLLGLGFDSQFGNYLIIGAGGELVEWHRDRAIVLLPATRELVEQALAGLRAAKLLDGFRGRARADKAAAVDAAMRLQEMLRDKNCAPRELEINPLIVRTEGNGAVAVDAVVKLRE